MSECPAERSLRVAFVDQTSKMGGAEWSLLDIVRERRKSFDDRVVLFEEGDFADRLRVLGVDVRVCPLIGSSASVKRESRWWRQVGSVGAVWQQATRLSEAVAGADLIYANTMKAFVISAIASRRSGIPLIFHVRDILSPAHFSGMNRRLIRVLCRWLPLTVIANSEATAEEFRRLVGHEVAPHVIYNGLDATPFENSLARHGVLNETIRDSLSIRHDVPVMGNFGRLARWKGQHVAIAAIKDQPDWNLLVVGEAMFGEDAYADELRRLAETFGVSDRVHFLGYRPDVADVMQACDVVWHTSIDPEPFGRVIVEAMLSRRPVVAADAGGAAEIIQQGRNGWLSPPGDPLALARATCDVLRSADPAMIRCAASGVASRFCLAERVQEINDLVQATVTTERRSILGGRMG